MRDLTPYDTGARLEPIPWVSPAQVRAGGRDADDYGKVDFENDESVTEVTVHVERADDGELIVHVYNHGSDPVRVEVEQ